MSRLSFSTLFVAVSLSGLGLAGCSQQKETVTQHEPVPIISDSLEFEKVLIEGDVKMYTAFADVNADDRPDLMIGTFGTGHVFDKKLQTIKPASGSHLASQDLSIQLRLNQKNTVSFESPYWPKTDVKDSVIPPG